VVPAVIPACLSSRSPEEPGRLPAQQADSLRHVQAVIDKKADACDNPLKNAPHTAAAGSSDTWDHAYSREQAAYSLPFVRARKFWPTVGRIDNPYGDRNLMCSYPPWRNSSNFNGLS
jgi:glycine dehydrogenase